ncbi:alpha/beta hydrolase [Segnochrobactrum spirostomi]|uniref:Alpha/beta fold hydrolase n=1 Tax=Segnochrobactrum spirostomi TaxID=2608987 RepID=A0A6A7Y6C4_9HYPH|nr:alpha/beta fold hydrolase [Segnochrobactrum spirostomi]MQT14850.1 alpha/beta fold hydrolase [Segnochrobactrum spirostomi]
MPNLPAASEHNILYEGGSTGVLLIHGLGGTPIELKRVARAVHAEGYTAACCTLAGHCGSESDLLATRWQDWYASIDAAFQRLSERCDRIVVGGLSLGAVLALHLAAQRPKQVHGLALYAPTLWYDGWSIPWYRFLLRLAVNTPIATRYRFMEREPYGIRDERIRAHLVAAMLSGDSSEAGLLCTPGPALRELLRLVAKVRPELPSIDAPTLLVHARNDDISDLRNSTYIASRLGGMVDLTVLDDSYHIVTLDRQRNVAIARTLDLLERVRTPRALGVMQRQYRESMATPKPAGGMVPMRPRLGRSGVGAVRRPLSECLR